MSLTARVPSGAETYKFISEVFSRNVESAARDLLVAWDCINSTWEDELTKGDTLYIPKSNTVTATEVVVGVKANSLNPFNTPAAELKIDQYWEAPVDIDTMTRRQTQAAMEEEAVELSAFAIKEKMDTSVCALFSALSGGSVYGSDGQTLTADMLIAIEEILNENNVPLDGKRYLIIDPSALSDMMKIDVFIREDYLRKGAIKNGIIGDTPIFGCQVRVTNNLVAAGTGAYAVMMHKRAIGGAAQIKKSWRKEFEELHNIRYQSEALWGVAEVNNTFGKAFYTRHA